MIDLEVQRKQFVNHIAKFIDYGNIKIVDFKRPDSNEYRIRFLFEEDYCRLHISGDLGELIATNYNNMTFKGFSDFVNNVGYFREKINCNNRRIYTYDSRDAKKDLKELLEEWDMMEEIIQHDRFDFETDEDKLEEFYEDVLEDFSDNTGVGSKGYDALEKYFDDVFEFARDIGKRPTGILDLYMLAFRLATEQLKEKGII